MLGGKGYYRGSSILVSGTAGTGKTSIAAHFAFATCKRGERCLYLAFEESPSQLLRNMRSIGVNLEPCRRNGLLRLHSSRPTLLGLEAHLVQIHKMVTEFEPGTVIVDPISNFIASGSAADAQAMLLRLIDFLKTNQITAMFTHLTAGGKPAEATDMGVSSLIDTWLLVRDLEFGGERNRGLYVIKSRGMAHSNQVREFSITSRGLALQDVYVGPEGVLTGSLRAAQEAREKAAALARAPGYRAQAPRHREAAGRDARADLGARNRARGRRDRGGARRDAGRGARACVGRRPRRDGETPRRSGQRAWEGKMKRATERSATKRSGSARRASKPESKWELRLYVAGQTPKSLAAMNNLRRVLDAHVPDAYRVEVIDLLANPRLAKEDQIVAIPTLVRKLPSPVRKIIGDLSDTERTLVGLQLRPG